MGLDEIINGRAEYESTLKSLDKEFPQIQKETIQTYEDFANQIYEQTMYLQTKNRKLLIESLENSADGSLLLVQKIRELESSIHSRDQRIDADSRILRQHKENEATIKRLKQEIAHLHIEKN